MQLSFELEGPTAIVDLAIPSLSTLGPGGASREVENVAAPGRGISAHAAQAH